MILFYVIIIPKLRFSKSVTDLTLKFWCFIHNFEITSDILGMAKFSNLFFYAGYNSTCKFLIIFQNVKKIHNIVPL